MTWRAYVDPNDHFGRGVRLVIGTEPTGLTHPYQLVSYLAEDGPVLQTVQPPHDGTMPPYRGMLIPHEIAEAIYGALHRVYGKQADDAVVEALKVERARVDKALDAWLRKATS